MFHRQGSISCTGYRRDSGLEGSSNDATVLETEDTICDVEDAGVVGDEEDGGAAFAGELAEEFDGGVAGGAVEGGGGFVGEDEAGLMGEGAGDGDALALAAGKGGGELILFRGETDGLEEGEGAAASLGWGGEVRGEGGGHLDVFAGGEEGKKVVGLEDEADLAADDIAGVIGGMEELVVEDVTGTLLNGAEGADEGEEGAFAGAAGAGEDDEFAGVDAE